MRKIACSLAAFAAVCLFGVANASAEGLLRDDTPPTKTPINKQVPTTVVTADAPTQKVERTGPPRRVARPDKSRAARAKAEVPRNDPLPAVSLEPINLWLPLPKGWKLANIEDGLPTVAVAGKPDGSTLLFVRHLAAEPRSAESQARAICSDLARNVGEKNVTPVQTLGTDRASCNAIGEEDVRGRVTVLHLGPNKETQLAVTQVWKNGNAADQRTLFRIVDRLRASPLPAKPPTKAYPLPK